VIYWLYFIDNMQPATLPNTRDALDPEPTL
jgi:hypothetical protein